MQKINVNFKKINKSEKGITLIALVTTVIILALISVPIVIHVNQVGDVKKFTEFKDDLLNIRESVSQAYSADITFSSDESKDEYIGPKFTGSLAFLNEEQDGNAVKNPNDDDNYFVIDAVKLNQRLNEKFEVEFDSLTYGDSNYDLTNITDDVYIINNKSRTVYYPAGYKYQDVTYYRYQESFTKIEVSEIPILKVGDNVTYKNDSTYSWNKYYAGQVTSGSETDDTNLQTFSSKNNDSFAINNWKVFSINENLGTAQLVSAIPSSAYITLGNDTDVNGAANGYNNSVRLLNEICQQLYGNESKNITARSINLSDIENVIKEDSLKNSRDEYTNDSSVKYNTQILSNNGDTSLNEKGAYITNKNYPQIYAAEANNVIDEVITKAGLKNDGQGDWKKGIVTSATSIHPYQTFWTARLDKSHFKYMNGTTGNTYYNLLIGDELKNLDSYWLATRTINLNSNYASFNVATVQNGIIGGSEIYNSKSEGKAISMKLRPMITVPIESITNVSANNWNIK